MVTHREHRSQEVRGSAVSNARWLHGMLIGIEGGGRVRFHYNPSSIKTNKTPAWNKLKAAGREQSILQYGCGEPIYYSFEVDLTRAGGDGYPRQAVETLLEMCRPTVKGAGVDRPPKVQLILGNAVNATCVVDSVEGDYGPLFSPQSLDPYLGKLSIKLVEIQ